MAIKAEIARRDLSDVKTDKLFELLAMYHKLLKEEYVRPNFMDEKDIEDAKTERLAREERDKALCIW